MVFKCKLHTITNDTDLGLIMNCRKSLVFFGNKTKSTEKEIERNNRKRNQQKAALMLP